MAVIGQGLRSELRAGALTITLNDATGTTMPSADILGTAADLVAAANTRLDVRVVVLQIIGAACRFNHTPSSAAAAHYLINTISSATKPIVVALRGTAAGLGVCIAAAADFVIASTGASLQLPPHVVAHVLDRGIATRALTHSGGLPSVAAARTGLVDHIVPDEAFESAVRADAQSLAAGDLSGGGISRAARVRLRADITATTLCVLCSATPPGPRVRESQNARAGSAI